MFATGIALASLALTGCRNEGADMIAEEPTSVASPAAPAPAPGPAPAPPPPAPPVGVASVVPIASNFDVNALLVPAWGKGTIPESGAPDKVGAFRFICNAAHLGYNDPIVYPGQKGKSHLHQFFGNTAVDENSTYESLRKTGESTCNNELNRSAYWMPAMLNGKGQVVRPDYVAIYYKRRPEDDPYCTTAGKGCVGIPTGLRFIMGYDMVAGNPPTGGFDFVCIVDDRPVVQGDTIVAAAKGCPVENSRLSARIHSPPCWDGVNLDSSDHRSHLSGMIRNASTNWVAKCPDSHPWLIPVFTLQASYTTDADLDRSGTWTPGKATWHLSSDVMAEHGGMMHEPGTTFHADYFEAWDPIVRKMWEDNCLDKLLSCSGGDLGNGLQLKMFDGFSWKASPRLVDVPPRS